MLPRKFISYHSLLPTGPFSFPSISRLVLSSLFKRQFSNTLSSPFLRLCECFYFHLDLVTRYLGQNARWYPEKIWERVRERVKERERERGGRGGGGRGKKNHTICGISRVRWANEPRFSTNLIFIPLVFFVTRPPLFLPRFEFILRLGLLLAVLSRCTVHLGFSSLRFQEFFVYAIIINFGPTSMENASGERVC